MSVKKTSHTDNPPSLGARIRSTAFATAALGLPATTEEYEEVLHRTISYGFGLGVCHKNDTSIQNLNKPPLGFAEISNNLVTDFGVGTPKTNQVPLYDICEDAGQLADTADRLGLASTAEFGAAGFSVLPNKTGLLFVVRGIQK